MQSNVSQSFIRNNDSSKNESRLSSQAVIEELKTRKQKRYAMRENRMERHVKSMEDGLAVSINNSTLDEPDKSAYTNNGCKVNER